MLGALIIVFREVIEAGLIIGIVLAATQTVVGSRKWISIGILGGIAGSCIVAAFTSTIAAFFDGFGQELFNATILSIAVIMLAWHNIWMALHGRQMAGELLQHFCALRAEGGISQRPLLQQVEQGFWNDDVGQCR